MVAVVRSHSHECVKVPSRVAEAHRYTLVPGGDAEVHVLASEVSAAQGLAGEGLDHRYG